MAERTVTIRLKIDNSGAVTGIHGYEQALGRAEQATDRLGQSAQRQGGLFSNLGTQIQGAIAGVTVGAVFTAIGSLNELGVATTQAERKFEALVGGPERVAEAMGTLREATGGIVTETQLTTDAVSLMMTGVAKDAEEAGRLMALGLQLGGEEGKEKLYQALRNQSYLVLDTVGISASQVRTLAEQYRAAGMESAAAFNKAVLEVGEQTRARLGDAVHASETAAARVQTQIANIIGDIGQTVSSAVEAGAQLILIGEYAVEQSHANAVAAREDIEEQIQIAQQFARDNPVTFQVVAAAQSAGENPSFSASDAFGELWARELIIAAQQNPGMSARSLMETMEPTSVLWSQQEREAYIRAVTAALEEANRVGAANVQITEEQNAALERQNALYEAQRQVTTFRQQEEAARRRHLEYLAGIAYWDAEITASEQVLADIRRQQIEVIRPQATQEIWSLGARQARYGAAMNAYDPAAYVQSYQSGQYNYAQLAQQYGNIAEVTRQPRGEVGGQALFTEAEAANAQEIADAMRTTLDAMQRAKDTGAPISDADLASARNYTDLTREMADNIRAGAELLQTITLPQVLGTDNANPLLTGGTDALVQYLSDTGVSDDLIQTITDNLDLASGRQTELSQRFEDDILPAYAEIFQTYGVEAGTQSYLAFLEGMRSVTAGTIPMPFDPLTMGGFMQVGRGGGGNQVTVGSGWGHNRLAQELGMTPQEMYSRGIVRPDQMLHPGETYGGGGSIVPLSDLGDAGIPFDMTLGSVGAGEGDGQYQPPDLSGIQGQSAAIALSWQEAGTASVGWAKSLDEGKTFGDGVEETGGKIATHFKHIADDSSRVRDHVKEISGVHDVTFSMSATVGRDMPPWFLDMLERGLVIIASRHGGTLPGTSTAGKGG